MTIRAPASQRSCTARGSGSACSTPSSAIRPSGACSTTAVVPGVEVEIARRRTLRPLRAHGKLLLIDDRAALVGSLALSPASLDRRRELAVVVRDPRLVAALAAFWRTHCEPACATAGLGAPAPAVELAS